jgi:L-seryl-tRNA(Ser) seleniumtransferase
MIDLTRFCAICHAAGVPVIVDAAAEYGWRSFLEVGADLLLFSAQKPMGGPTAGIIAGRREFVRACHAQQRGIGRPMKAGKEAVVGAIAALERWARLDHAAIEAAVEARAARAAERLAGLPGVRVSAVRDETGNPFSRVVIAVDPAVAGFTAYGLAQTLAQGEPRILLRNLYADQGFLQLDVRRLDETTLDLVCARIAAAVAAPSGVGLPMPPGDRSAAALRAWLGEAMVRQNGRLD